MVAYIRSELFFALLAIRVLFAPAGVFNPEHGAHYKMSRIRPYSLHLRKPLLQTNDKMEMGISCLFMSKAIQFKAFDCFTELAK